jgi:hypothetical protein
VERAELERRLLAEGCRDPLTVWQQTRILLDGHNRYELCLQHGLPFSVTEVSLPSREAALAWVAARQQGRRNLTREGHSYVRGQRYLRERRPRGGTGANQHGPAQTGQNGPSAPGVLDRLAAELRVSARTLKRDARFARDVDAITAHCGAEVRGWLLTRDARLTQKDVERIALLGPSDQRRVLEQVRREGRVTWPEEGKGQMTVPTETGELIRILMLRLGAERAEEVGRGLIALARSQQADAAGPEKRSRRRGRGRQEEGTPGERLTTGAGREESGDEGRRVNARPATPNLCRSDDQREADVAQGLAKGELA